MADLEPDWHLWRSFLGVLEAGSLSAAARKLSASQPTLGRHIEELETALGTILFERTARGLHPTAMAEKLAASVIGARDALGHARTLAAGAAETLEGSVRITASDAVSHFVLPHLLPSIRAKYPEIQLELVSSDLASNLLLREADIAIRMFRPGQLEVIGKKIGQMPIRACAHRSYLARRGTPQTPEEMRGHDLIGFDKSEDIIRVAKAMGHDLRREDFVYRTDSQTLIWEMVKAGLGISFAQGQLIELTPGIEAILPEMHIPPLEVWMVTHRELTTARRIRVVYDLLGELMKGYIDGKPWPLTEGTDSKPHDEGSA